MVSTFNLGPPPGFRGLDPDLPVTIYHRHLPHWRQSGATYFVTFRLGDSLPQETLDFLKRLRAEWERTHPPPRTEEDWKTYAQDVTRHAERWLDEGYGECHLREPQWSSDLRDRLHHFHNQRYELGCWAIMPNHCHLVIRPFEEQVLEDLIGAMKGVFARHLNAAREMAGPVWEEESYDQIVRDEEHLWRIVQYIGRNPQSAGLPVELWCRWINPDWEPLGWRFQ